MGKQRIKPNYRRRVLRLPDLDHCKSAVLNSLGSPASRRVYEYAIDQFIAWYCSEPRLAFNRIVVVRYRMYLESRASGRQHHQPTARSRAPPRSRSRRLGLAESRVGCGISRVKGVKQLGFRSGNWLSAEQSSEVLKHACGDSMRAKRDYAMLAMLFGCGFRRSELVGLELDDIQMRQGHWAVVDLIGKGGHIRTVPIPNWVKAALDQWTRAAEVTEGKIFEPSPEGKGVGQRHLAECRVVRGQDLLRESRAWSILHRMTCAGRVRSCATPAVVSLSRFSSCSGTHRSRPRNAISAANRISGHPVNDLFDLRSDRQPQEADCVNLTQRKGCHPVETVIWSEIECRATEDRTMSSPSAILTITSYPNPNEPTWSRSEKAIARKAFDAALKRELHEVDAGSKGDRWPDQATVGPVGLAEIT